MKSSLIKFFSENLLLKLIALMIAVLLWSHVSSRETELEVPSKVNLEIRNLPRTLVRISDLPNEIEIKARGPRTALRALRNRELRYVLDLAGANPGPMVAKFYASKIEGLASGAKVTEIYPSQVQIILSERKNKTVRVRPVFRGEPPEGLEPLKPVVEPELVEISGATEEIDILTEVETEIIDLTGHGETFSVEVGLDLINRHVEPVREKGVRVTVPIGRPKIKKMFYGIPITVRNAEYKYKLSRQDLDVQLEGSAEQLTLLTAGDLTLVVDAADMKPGEKREVTPTLELAGGIALRNYSMPPVTIQIAGGKKPNKTPSGKKKLK
ncbi:MAG: CdaR family protein [Candidatus Lernaella stagnicola]|nr:CdaR family protein [Candidatus Lernaella stagnicola]